MPRAHSTEIVQQTAVPEQDYGNGCLSDFFLIPFAVILFSAVFASFAWNQNVQADELPPFAAVNISPIFRMEVLYWADPISNWASASQLDPNLVATIMQIESCGDPRAISSAGAMGLFQVMPFHFYERDDPFSPDTNAARGLAYLAKSYETSGGDVRLTMAGYNGGMGLIDRADWTWPAETKRYVQYGAPIYEDARNGLDFSNTMNEWYEKYGVSLCIQAHQRLGLP